MHYGQTVSVQRLLLTGYSHFQMPYLTILFPPNRSNELIAGLWTLAYGQLFLATAGLLVLLVKWMLCHYVLQESWRTSRELLQTDALSADVFSSGQALMCHADNYVRILPGPDYLCGWWGWSLRAQALMGAQTMGPEISREKICGLLD